MKAAYDLSLDVSGARGTLSLRGVVGRMDIEAASRLCFGLPRHVHVLRIDLRNVVDLDEAARPVLRALIREWRMVRRRYVSIIAASPAPRRSRRILEA